MGFDGATACGTREKGEELGPIGSKEIVVSTLSQKV